MTQHETWTVPPGMAISDGAGGSTDPLASVRVTPPITVSSAELLAVSTTPKVLVAAPGAGMMAVPVQVAFVRHAGTAYTLPANVHVTYDGTPGTQLESDNFGWSGHFGLTGTTKTVGLTPARDQEFAATVAENKAIVLTSTSNPTSGTGAVTVIVTYLLASTA